MTLYFDFETVDPGIKLGKGPGWVFNECKILSMAYAIDDEPIEYTTNKNLMMSLLNEYDEWVAHNISYELGCCKMMGVDFKKKKVYCTKAGAIIYDNTLMHYSLDSLSERYLGEKKLNSELGQAVIDKKLVVNKKGQVSKSFTIEKADKWAVEHMDVMILEAPDLVEKYNKKDVWLCRELHKKFIKEVGSELYNEYSNVNKMLVEMRAKGVAIDTKKVFEVQKKLIMLMKEQEEIIHKWTGKDVNYRSTKQLADIFKRENIKIPVTELGNPNIDKKVLETIDHPLALAVIEAKKYGKALEDFTTKLLELQHHGRIHGEMGLFGAVRTGRFSHKNPNLGQIPRRDEIVGPLMRSLFVPDEGKDWYTIDFSNQEPRLMVHFAIKLHNIKAPYEVTYFNGKKVAKTFNVPEILDLQKAYVKDPRMSSHAYNLDVIKRTTGITLTKDQAKTIALGKAYGMGKKKLIESLKIDKDTGNKLIEAFDNGSPHLKVLAEYCQYVFKKMGRLKTIGRRTLKYDGFDHKALNKLIQGSASDQVCKTLNKLYELNIIPQIVVHDEVSGSFTEKEAQMVKQVMESVLKLEIPVVAELKKGRNWAECK